MTEEDSWLKSLINKLELVKSPKFSFMLSSTSRKMYFVSYSYLNAILGTSNTRWGQLLFFTSDTASTAIVSSPLFHQRSCHVQRWKPLCGFLGCVVPTVALQRENVKGELVKVPLSETRYGRQCKRKIQRAVFVILTVIIAIIIAMITTAFVIL